MNASSKKFNDSLSLFVSTKSHEEFDEAKDLLVDEIISEIQELKDAFQDAYPEKKETLAHADETTKKLTEFKLMNFQDVVDLANGEATIH